MRQGKLLCHVKDTHGLNLEESDPIYGRVKVLQHFCDRLDVETRADPAALLGDFMNLMNINT